MMVGRLGLPGWLPHYMHTSSLTGSCEIHSHSVPPSIK